MAEEIGFVFGITRDKIREMFEKNSRLKEAFCNLWQNQHMDEWLKDEAWPVLKGCPGTIDDFQELQKTAEIVVMTETVRVGIELLLAEPATSLLVDCTVQAIKQNAESIASACKAAFFESVIKMWAMWSLEHGMETVTMTN